MEGYQLIKVRATDVTPEAFEIAQKRANYYITHSGMSYPESYVETFGISESELNKITKNYQQKAEDN